MIKTELSNTCLPKRKRLKSIRVRNALRSKIQQTRVRMNSVSQKSKYSSTSEDSNENAVGSLSQFRPNNNVEQQTALNEYDMHTKKKKCDMKVDLAAQSITNIVKNGNDRLTLEEQVEKCSRCTECEDLNESDYVRRKSENNNSIPCKFENNEDNLRNGSPQSLINGRTFECPLCISRKFREVDKLIFHLMYGHNLDLSELDLNNLRHLIVYKQNEISITVAPPKFSRPFTLARYKLKRYQDKEPASSLHDSLMNSEMQMETTRTIKSKARSDDGMFTCLKCYCTFENEEEFYNHVKHNHIWTDEEISRLWMNGAEIDPSEFWCPECSSSFITKCALSMHIKGSHEFLYDIQLYLEKIGYEGEVPLTENQCDICFSVFDGVLEFEKHVRSHGLAFLRRQQLLSKIRKLK
ncbi:uncharacterized protein LOC110842558 [Folsomia candida]|uniref:uncharacterized protein LOC110842558 n=1 Tax=Folsomia candida TaxID=158441 RepID=UPI000B9097CB|nr:uncharacterized protein LOC110842558 [Folsomia candida]XP_021944020.1 uncharacterized protein LOC110842558 [Folsomia candida]XP_035702057.1 uncharacterized protein LOC110842558 [Folsomia candida]